MNKKNKYSAPAAEAVIVNLANQILDGSWLLQGGQGDFNYGVDEDNEFA